jgi:hypothetical protein
LKSKIKSNYLSAFWVCLIISEKHFFPFKKYSWDGECQCEVLVWFAILFSIFHCPADSLRRRGAHTWYAVYAAPPLINPRAAASRIHSLCLFIYMLTTGARSRGGVGRASASRLAHREIKCARGRDGRKILHYIIIARARERQNTEQRIKIKRALIFCTMQNDNNSRAPQSTSQSVARRARCFWARSTMSKENSALIPLLVHTAFIILTFDLCMRFDAAECTRSGFSNFELQMRRSNQLV